jgi:uridine kinase
MVRDSRTRGRSPEVTLQQWPSVIRGAQKYIFPYQEHADAMFNTALIYELSVLKGHAEPLLRTVPEASPVFGEAQRLLSMLHFVPFIPEGNVPNASILREFIGGSCFGD